MENARTRYFLSSLFAFWQATSAPLAVCLQMSHGRLLQQLRLRSRVINGPYPYLYLPHPGNKSGKSKSCSSSSSRYDAIGEEKILLQGPFSLTHSEEVAGGNEREWWHVKKALLSSLVLFSFPPPPTHTTTPTKASQPRRQGRHSLCFPVPLLVSAAKFGISSLQSEFPTSLALSAMKRKRRETEREEREMIICHHDTIRKLHPPHPPFFFHPLRKSFPCYPLVAAANCTEREQKDEEGGGNNVVNRTGEGNDGENGRSSGIMFCGEKERCVLGQKVAGQCFWTGYRGLACRVEVEGRGGSF